MIRLAAGTCALILLCLATISTAAPDPAGKHFAHTGVPDSAKQILTVRLLRPKVASLSKVSRVDLFYSLSEEADVKITLTDLSGETVDDLASYFQKPGDYQLKLDLNGLEPASYYLRIDANKQVTTERLTIEK